MRGRRRRSLLASLVRDVLAPAVVGGGADVSDFARVPEAKAAALGCARLLAEASEALCPGGDAEPWTRLATALYALLGQLNSAPQAKTLGTADEDEPLSGDAAFSELRFGEDDDDDTFPEIPDAVAFARGQLAPLFQSQPRFRVLHERLGAALS